MPLGASFTLLARPLVNVRMISSGADQAWTIYQQIRGKAERLYVCVAAESDMNAHRTSTGRYLNVRDIIDRHAKLSAVARAIVMINIGKPGVGARANQHVINVKNRV